MTVEALIEACAKVPSFTTFEERIHPLIRAICAKVPTTRIEHIAENNLVVFVPGKRDAPPVALTAHLDKINHFGEAYPDEIPFKNTGEQLIGQMDDTAGLGIVLRMMFESQEQNFPPLYLFLSEVEEGTGLRKHRHLLKNNGEGLFSGIGAQRITEYMLDNYEPPALVITLDTTPKFKGKPGIALYSKFWHPDASYFPSNRLSDRTVDLIESIKGLHPDILISNAYNDYLEYGKSFNKSGDLDIPSIAIEPAIYPYHQLDEGVFCADIHKIVHLLSRFLTDYDFELYQQEQ